MTTNGTLRRWIPWLLGVTSIALVPWMVVLGLTLPGVAVVQNWSVAWVGLDVLLAAGCAVTAVLNHGGDPHAPLAASATATIAVLDAWFDTTTAFPGLALVEALLDAAGELTLAACCLYLALDHPAGRGRPR